MNTANNKAFQLKWVLYGSGLGILLVAIAYFGVVTEFKSAPIQYVSLAVAFIFTGMLAGYASDGQVFKEIGVAGAVVTVATFSFILAFPGKIELTAMNSFIGILFAIVLTYAGAWAGENMQHDPDVLEGDVEVAGFRWHWIVVAFVLGFGLNILFSIILAPIYTKDLMISFYMFMFSTFLTGAIVAWYSPGVTLKEPSVAGVLAVLVEWILVEFVLDLPVSLINLSIGLLIGFALTLAGAIVGEKLQERFG